MSDTKTWKEWAADGTIAFWDCDDDREQLNHESFEEAVEHEVEDGSELSFDVDGGVENAIRDQYPNGLTVFGYRRREVTQKWRAGEAEWLAQAFAEHVEDEYGDHFTGTYEVFEEDAEETLAAEFLRVLEKLKLEPWQCEQVAKVHLSLDELLAMLREMNPSWFTKDGAA